MRDRIDLGSADVFRRIFRQLDALLGGLGLALVLGEIAVEGCQFRVDRGEARFDGGEALLRILHPLLGNLRRALNQRQFVHALAVDGTATGLQRAFDTLVLGESFDAFGVDVLRLGIIIGFFRCKLGGEFGSLPGEAGFLFRQRRLAPGEPRLARLSRRHAFLLLFDGATAIFDLTVHIAFDSAFRLPGSLSDAVELMLVILPGFRREQFLRLAGKTARDRLFNVGDDAGDLVLGAKLGSPHALRLREDRREKAVEREEDARRHASEEHDPQHRIADDDADDLDVGSDQVAGGVEREQRHQQKTRAEHQELVACLRPVEGHGAGVLDVGLPGPLQKQHEKRDKKQKPYRAAEPGLRRTADERRRTGTRLSVHARGKAFADQPRDDQHDALNAERHHAGEQRLAGEIEHAFPGSPSCRRREHDARRAEQRQPPVREDRLFNRCPEPAGDAGSEQ